MTPVAAALVAYREHPEPRPGATDNPLRLASSVDAPTAPGEVDLAWPGRRLPEQLVQLWAAARGARLLVDVDHGQWGLVLLSPAGSAERTRVEHSARPDDYQPDDIVVGEFLGDQELVVVAGGEAHQQVLVALPLDPRAHWYVAADDLAQFLSLHLRHGGDKYWESIAERGRGTSPGGLGG